jgi:outer membrane protein assembly factor BamB
MNRFKTIVCLPILILFFIQVNAQSLSQWRGLNRDGIYNEPGLLNTWPEKGPSLLWSTEEIGNGYGSPIENNGRVYVNGEIDSTSHLFAFDLKGKLLWKSAFGKEFTGSGFSSNFPGNRSTPTLVDGLIYVSSGNGKIACFETSNGTLKWITDMVYDLHGRANEFGYSESLLVNGDLVYCYPGGSESNVVALNRFTGKQVWVSKALGDTVSFCSPILIKLPSREILITFSIRSMFALDANTGTLLWSQKQDSVQFGVQGNMPIYKDGYLYYVAGDGNGAVKLELSPDGLTYRELWRNRAFTNDMGGFVIVKNKIYGTAANKKMLACDTQTGQLSDSLRLSSGGIIYADGNLYCYTDKNEVHLISLASEKMKLVSSFKCEKGTKEALAHPVIGEGILFIRHGKALMAYQLK